MLPSRAAEWPSALGCLWPALSESGCGDNKQYSFSRSFADSFSQHDHVIQAVTSDGSN